MTYRISRMFEESIYYKATYGWWIFRATICDYKDSIAECEKVIQGHYTKTQEMKALNKAYKKGIVMPEKPVIVARTSDLPSLRQFLQSFESKRATPDFIGTMAMTEEQKEAHDKARRAYDHNTTSGGY